MSDADVDVLSQTVYGRPVSFETEGTLEDASGNKPFFLAGKENVWYVEEGRVEVFTVGMRDGEPVGARTHFITVEPGDFMFGMDLEGIGVTSGFLAVGKLGTKLRRMTVTRLWELANEERLKKGIGERVDRWVTALSETLTRDIIPGPIVDVNLVRGPSVHLTNKSRARSAKGVVWLHVRGGSLLFIGMEEIFFEGGDVLFPLATDTWVESSTDSEKGTEVKPYESAAVATHPAFWAGLEAFHKALCICEFINKRLAAVDEWNRLKSKARHAEAARDAAIADLASALDQTSTITRPALGAAAEAEEDDGLLDSCRQVGKALAIEMKDHPEATADQRFEDRLGMYAKASRVRLRPVALRGDWFKEDNGPILGRREATKEPVALLPTSSRGYDLYDPKTKTHVPLTEDLAAELSPFGMTFYRPFPDGPMGVKDLLKFGARGLRNDLLMVLGMGATMGVLGSLTPYFTGRIFDTAIPMSDRNQLVQFTLTLIIAALASAAFKIVQSISVLRIQGKMDYSVQAALWDRLLNLPSTFFREYNSGDLADRAGGINQIRDLVSRAGVSATLGIITSVFYVGLMFTYSAKMAAIGILLTLLFVAFTSATNLLQLRSQRGELAQRGKISGLVLQLISGVAKLRVCGAENHAFRVWAAEFSKMTRMGFRMGGIRNRAEVFYAGFPILSNIVIFATLASVQASGAAKLSTGQFIAFTAAYGMFLASVQALAEASLELLAVVPIYERLEPIITTPAEIDETRSYPGKLTGRIEISHVHFRYSEDSPWILKDVSLKIRPGEFIGFVGGSGSGKSTMMRLMLGFETPQRGSVYYDGQDLATLDLREVRQQIGVVLQDSKVLPTDIFRNIVGTSSLTIEDAWAAAEAAGLAQDVRDMPMGMHTYVPEGGGGLSGGQKQRLIIARSIVRKPRVLFLDEATSALDNRTQRIVAESTERLQATRIVIAHRLSTIVNADRICVFKDGNIAEMGTYDELMAKNGIFADLAKRQIA